MLHRPIQVLVRPNEQNSEWGIETLSLAPRPAAAKQVRTNRIPNGELKPAHLNCGAFPMSGPNEQNSEWGIETDHCPIRAISTDDPSPNEQNSEWGIETFRSTYASNPRPRPNEQNSEWGIETYRSALSPNALALVRTNRIPNGELKQRAPGLHVVAPWRPNEQNSEWGIETCIKPGPSPPFISSPNEQNSEWGIETATRCR